MTEKADDFANSYVFNAEIRHCDLLLLGHKNQKKL